MVLIHIATVLSNHKSNVVQSFILLLGASFCLPTIAAEFKYRVEINAPAPYKKLLADNLDINKWQGNPLMNLEQLQRLIRESPVEIQGLLGTEGFYSPKIASSLIQEENIWVARFNVDPGEPARIASVDLRFSGEIENNKEIARARMAKLQDNWPLRSGQIFRQAEWEAAKRTALTPLIIERYPGARVADSQAIVDPQKNEVALKVVFDSGPEVRFGDLRIDGLQRYPSRVVQNLNPISPGSYYDQAQLIEFQNRLAASGYFATVSVTAEVSENNPRQAPVLVSVVENKTKKLTFGIGYSTNTGNRAQVNFQHNDILNRAWRLDTGIQIETKRQIANFDISLPARANGYRDSFGTEFERTDLQGLVTRKFGMGAKRQRTRGDIETLTALQYTRERQDVSGADSKLSRALTLNHSWTARRVDDLLYPTQGYLLNAQIGGGTRALLSDQDFLRNYVRWMHFFPVGQNGTFMTKVELGATLARSRQGIPQDFLFRAGGQSSLRGYGYQSLGVREGDAVVGGRYLAIANFEYVHWLTQKWGAAVFYDVGDAADSLRDYKAVHGYGVGARWRSPVGPISVDLAHGHNVGTYRLHFSVGFSF